MNNPSKSFELGKGSGYSKVLNRSIISTEDVDDDEDIVEVNLSENQIETSPQYSPINLNNNNFFSLNANNLNNNDKYMKFYDDNGTFSPLAIWNTLTFGWMAPLLRTGSKRPIMQEDLYNLSDVDQAERIFSSYNYEMNTLKSNPKRINSLTYVFAKAFGKPFFIAGLLKFVHDCLLFVGPLLLHATIRFLRDPSQPLSYGLFYVTGFFLSQVIMSLLLRQYFWLCYRTGMHFRSAVVTAVYDKSLLISSSVLSRRNTGEITNLMSVDSTRLQDLTPYLHAIWYSFLQIALAMYFLWQQLGAACLAGVSIIIIMIPVTAKISKYLRSLQANLTKIRDERVKLVGEVLYGIKVIKFEAWEPEFIQRITQVRSDELFVYRKYVIAQSASSAVYTAIPLIVAIVTFAAFIGAGNVLEVETALTSLALFNILQFPLFMLPNVINNIVEASVSVGRVQSFLMETEKEEVPTFPLKEIGVSMFCASAAWEQTLLSESQAQAKKITISKADANSNNSVWGTISTYLNSYRDIELWTDWLLKAPYDDYDNVNARSHFEDSLVVARMAASEIEIARLRSRIEGSEYSMIIPKLLVSSNTDVNSESVINVLHSKSDDDNTNNSNGNDDKSEEKYSDRMLAISRITLHAKKGDLLCIVGSVGSGKTSLLASILGDIRRLPSYAKTLNNETNSNNSNGINNQSQDFGDISLRGSIAYVGQRPFICNATVRENILFGLPFEESKYYWCIEQAALIADLKILDAGDHTQIGERGINLSGGQKTRVALARALYADAEIYILDDPLAAVDSHVGQFLFEICIMGLKKRGKCIILVTNMLQFVRNASHIIVLKDGRIEDEGTFRYLRSNGGTFSELLQSSNEKVPGSITRNESDKNIRDATSKKSTPTPPYADTHSSNVKEVNTKPWENFVVPDEDLYNYGDDKKDSLRKTETALQERGTLISEEDRNLGQVTREVYLKWVKSGGGEWKGGAVLAIYLFAECVTVLSSWWLSYWSENKDSRSPWFFLWIYILINAFVVIAYFVRELYVRMMGLESSKTLFSGMLDSIMYSTMGFFDTTPIGRVLNRFGKDIYTVDEQIPQTMRMYLSTLARVAGIILYICIILHLFLVALIPILIAYFLAQRYFISTQREITRLDSTSRSPIYALFSETLDGLSTIRAFHVQDRMRNLIYTLLDSNQQAYFLKFSANCWLAVRLEFAGSLIVTFTALFAVLGRDNESHSMINNPDTFAGMAGLALSLALSVTQSLNWSVRMASDLESQMISVERIDSYIQLEDEAPHHNEGDARVPNEWPKLSGVLEFQDVCMRYRSNLPLVLKYVSLKIKGGEKVGVCGRTGAGKSTLLSALLRLVEIESGSITLDGINIAFLGLNRLRSVVAVIPQDPVLFSGTIRSNLDPFCKFTDEMIWDAIHRTQLGKFVSSLEEIVAENGQNYSVGQRQLLTIARAFLSKARIIVMDEATASVDVETDIAIQKMIRDEFFAATSITIAHRLNTIMDSDRVLVLDAGQVAEFDTPSNLLEQPHSIFAGLVGDWEEGNEGLN